MSSSSSSWEESELVPIIKAFATAAQNADSSINVWKVCEKYIIDTKSTRKSEEIIKKARQAICTNSMYLKSYDFETNVKVHFALKIPIGPVFMKRIREHGSAEFDNLNTITSFIADDGGLKLGAPKVKPHRVPIEPTEKMFRFLETYSKVTSLPVTDDDLADDYKQNSGSRNTIVSLIERFRSAIKPNIQISKQFDIPTRVRMLFVTGTPLGDGFLARIRKQAFVQVDNQNRIEAYLANDDSLELKKDMRSSMGCYKDQNTRSRAVSLDPYKKRDVKKTFQVKTPLKTERFETKKEASLPKKAITCKRSYKSDDSLTSNRPIKAITKVKRNNFKRIQISSDSDSSDVGESLKRRPDPLPKRHDYMEPNRETLPPHKQFRTSSEVIYDGPGSLPYAIPLEDMKKEEMAQFYPHNISDARQQQVYAPVDPEVKQEVQDIICDTPSIQFQPLRDQYLYNYMPNFMNSSMTASIGVETPQKDYQREDNVAEDVPGSTSTKEFLKLLRGFVLTIDSAWLIPIGILIQRAIDETANDKVPITDVIIALKTAFRMITKKASSIEEEENSLSLQRILPLLKSVVFSLDAPITSELMETLHGVSDMMESVDDKVPIKTLQRALETTIELVTPQYFRL